MSDYSPVYVGFHEIQNWFDPPLSDDDFTKAALLVHIEAVEKYIEHTYELTSATDAKIPALLLVVSRIIGHPNIAKNHYALKSETIRNYGYTLDTSASPNTIKITLEEMAHKMLRQRSYVKDDKLKIFISNL